MTTITTRYRNTRFYSAKRKDSVTVTVEIEVDWQALADYFGRKVAENKSGKSAIQGGAIKARIVK